MPEVQVVLPRNVDIEAWRRRHAAAEVPDRLPYGLDRLAADDLSVSFASSGPGSLLARKVRNRSKGLEFGRPRSRTADAFLAWDEMAGVPLALSPKRRGRPLVSVVIWGTDEPDLAWKRVVAAGLSRASALLVYADAQHEALVERWQIDPSRITTVRMGVDTDFFASGVAARDPRLVVSAGNDRRRDWPLLLDAMHRLSRSSGPVRFAAATGAPMPGRLEDGWSWGRTTHAEWRHRLQTAACAVVATVPNVHASGATSVLEAMACGCPVVATCTESLAEYVEDGVDGLLVPPGDAAALANAVGRVLDDPELARRLVAAGRRTAEAWGNSRRMADDAGRVVRQVLAEGRQR